MGDFHLHPYFIVGWNQVLASLACSSQVGGILPAGRWVWRDWWLHRLAKWKPQMKDEEPEREWNPVKWARSWLCRFVCPTPCQDALVQRLIIRLNVPSYSFFVFFSFPVMLVWKMLSYRPVWKIFIFIHFSNDSCSVTSGVKREARQERGQDKIIADAGQGRNTDSSLIFICSPSRAAWGAVGETSPTLQLLTCQMNVDGRESCAAPAVFTSE